MGNLVNPDELAKETDSIFDELESSVPSEVELSEGDVVDVVCDSCGHAETMTLGEALSGPCPKFGESYS